jgi:hypothetical protein
LPTLQVTTVAGDPSIAGDMIANNFGRADGIGTASFREPRGLALVTGLGMSCGFTFMSCGFTRMSCGFTRMYYGFTRMS